MNQAPTRYHPALIALHWAVLLLIAAAYACIELREAFPRDSAPRELLKTLHFSFGLTVFALVIARAAVRVRMGSPPINPPLDVPMRLAAAGMHIALYLFMIVMPLLGWATLSAEGKAIPFFGIPLFAITPEGKDLAEIFEETHETIGEIGYFLIGLHAAAALFHHFIRRDNTLLRMSPFGRR